MADFESEYPFEELEKALTCVIDSIAAQDNAISGILKTEGDILQKAKNLYCTADELKKVNDSVESVMRHIVRLQLLLQFKLEDAGDLLHKLCDFSDDEDFDEI